MSEPMHPRTIVITGAASGLGKAFFLHYAQTSPPGTTIHALDIQAFEYQVASHACIITHDASMASVNHLQAFRRELHNEPIDLLIHCAGIRGLVSSVHDSRPNDVAAAENITVMNAATMMDTLQVNSVGTFILIQVLLSSLRLSAAQRGVPPQVIVMSSRMGSITHNSTGGGYAYRASKVALNSIVKSYSLDVPEVCFALIHPGRVESGLVKCREEGAISAEESVADMLELMKQIGVKPGLGSGCYVDRLGVPIGW